MHSSPMGQVVLVGFGGFVGACARYFLSRWVHHLLPQAVLSLGTFTVNLLGCLAIGVLAGRLDAGQLMGPGVRLFLIVGVLGGFTTFSTFAVETVGLFQEDQFLKAAAYAMVHLLCCLTAVWVGHFAARHA